MFGFGFLNRYRLPVQSGGGIPTGDTMLWNDDDEILWDDNDEVFW